MKQFSRVMWRVFFSHDLWTPVMFPFRGWKVNEKFDLKQVYIFPWTLMRLHYQILWVLFPLCSFLNWVVLLELTQTGVHPFINKSERWFCLIYIFIVLVFWLTFFSSFEEYWDLFFSLFRGFTCRRDCFSEKDSSQAYIKPCTQDARGENQSRERESILIKSFWEIPESSKSAKTIKTIILNVLVQSASKTSL